MEYALLILLAVQIIAESMPISSSGHVALLITWLSNLGFDIQSIQSDAFINIFLHIPNILIFSLFFIKNWGNWIKNSYFAFFGSRFSPASTRRLRNTYIYIMVCTILSGLSTFGGYLYIYGVLYKKYPFLQTSPALMIGFMITSSLLLSLKMVKRGEGYYMPTYLQAIIIGLVQGLALLPGISRMASTYVAGRWLGLNPVRSFQYSLLIGVPVMLGGVVIECLAQWQTINWSIFNNPLVLIVMGAASVISWFALGLTYQIMVGQTIWKYGIYMLVPIISAVLLLVF